MIKKILSKIVNAVKRRKSQRDLDTTLIISALWVLTKQIYEQTEILKGVLDLLQPLRKPMTTQEAADHLAKEIEVKEAAPQ